MSDALKLHLGSGDVSLAGWINIDIETPEADMRLDLREALPFADASVSHVFSEHVIEHIEYDDALRLLRECQRVLKPDGVVRVTTPDLAWLVESYLSAVTDGWGDLWQPGTPAQMINQGMRYWGHCFLYDRPELYRIFRQAGFGDVRFVAWRSSADPVLEGLETRPFNNELIIEARIPDRTDSEKEIVEVRSHLGNAETDLIAAQGQELEALRLQLTEMRARATQAQEARDAHVANVEEAASLRLQAVAAESAERARLLSELEHRYHAKVSEVDELQAHARQLESDNQSLIETIAELRGFRAELDKVRQQLGEVAAQSRARADEIDRLAATLHRHEAYMLRVRASLPGRLLLRFVKLASPI